MQTVASCGTHTVKTANARTLSSPKPHSTAEKLPFSPRLFAMRTDVGRLRQCNEDACAALPECGAFVVCDGVGGAAAGEVASHLAAEIFLNTMAHASRSARGAVQHSLPPSHPHTRLQRAVHAANHAVFQRGQKSKSLRGMGTTLVAALFQDASAPGNRFSLSSPTLWLANVGDSRCYLLRDGSLHLLTQDHSLVEEQVRAGVITRLEAATSPIRNIITRAIGTQAAVEPDISAHPVKAGDIFLLTTDGLTRELMDDAIARILLQHGPTALDRACNALVDAANTKGGQDNITVLVVACT